MNFKKILYVIFWGLFLIPEILWSPIINIVSGQKVNYIFRQTAFQDFSFGLILLIYLLQTLGSIGISILSFKISHNISGSKRSLLVAIGVVFIFIGLFSVFATLLSLLAHNLVLF